MKGSQISFQNSEGIYHDGATARRNGHEKARGKAVSYWLLAVGQSEDVKMPRQFEQEGTELVEEDCFNAWALFSSVSLCSNDWRSVSGLQRVGNRGLRTNGFLRCQRAGCQALVGRRWALVKLTTAERLPTVAVWNICILCMAGLSRSRIGHEEANGKAVGRQLLAVSQSGGTESAAGG